MPQKYHWLILSREYSYSRTTNLKRTVNCMYVAKHMSCAHHMMLDQNTLIHTTLQDSHTVLQCKCVKGNDIIYKKLYQALLTQRQTI